MVERLCQRWRITGWVQGVGYRAWMVEQARALAVDGWVRNLATGEVEAVVAGAAGVLEGLRAACREGPRHARVERIETSAADPALVGPRGFRTISDVY